MADNEGLTNIIFEQEDGNQLPVNIKDIEFNDELPGYSGCKTVVKPLFQRL